ncbi:MAG TPA: carboxypeptidase regulatory-like domain-containing protein [Terriglobales bacterium]|nr:carboxypeptidase regulatory-like domain-containing protein [Terriglobales bacterium]
MTWRWATSFRFAAFTLATAAWCAGISGKVALTDSKRTREKDDSGVVVWLELQSGAAPATARGSVTIAHKGKTFVPHVVAVRTGSKVTFPNLDPFFHNAFSNYDGQVFDIGLHPPGSAREQVFSRPGVVRLFCNIHPTMSAVIVVLDTPYFAVTNAQGEFHIADVPPGDYRLKLFYERALPDVLAPLERQITIGPEDVTLPSMAISEAGYLVTPHKNKFGKDYPAIIVDQYPNGAGRKQ